ncbi:MAG TPA: hypothetical protein VK689_17210, partial [Armatimonadota bacterium]|nr:hypothetical protein [Armatimonadota bacterium]
LDDEEPDGDLVHEIGARRKRFGRDALSVYKAHIRRCFEKVGEAVRPGGFVATVLPVFDRDSAADTTRRAAVEECGLALMEKGLQHEGDHFRILPTKRRYHNQHWTSLEREMIRVYRKP